MKQHVELLSPAGNYQAFLGALNAGADAVYLGGRRFGARAYADNFTTEEIIRALRYAHLHGKKIYLTLNTLVKEEEFLSLSKDLSPLYEAGLDGVIIQDLGLWRYIREYFPQLELHASTQMTITGSRGAAFLKEIGVSRIVPARELSLAELSSIKKETGLQMECFIHGAMCYCYSGQCLFSSILGARSGNRGRCAQPCRLPYHILEQKGLKGTDACYPLSLKDLCTIEYMPRLIEAGIDSFKIEGRMKKPEYAAGVTAIYRKYIDSYYENPKHPPHVQKEDWDKLGKLYIRSEIQTGYYERENGREMITLHTPGYAGSDEKLLAEISEKYLEKEHRIPVSVKGVFRIGEPSVLQLEGEGLVQTTCGECVQRALDHPMDEEAVSKQLRKTGGSFVRIEKEELLVDDNIFLPVKQLNALRRNAVAAFEDCRIEAQGFAAHRHAPDRPVPGQGADEGKVANFSKKASLLHVMVHDLEQLKVVIPYHCSRIYIDSDFYLRDSDQISQYFENCQKNEIFLALPYVVRDKDTPYLCRLTEQLPAYIGGFLVRNLESYDWVKNLPRAYEIVTDTGMYCFNTEAFRMLQAFGQECYLPWELNRKELKHLVSYLKGKFGQDVPVSMVAYGTIPMMVSANCLKKTTGRCTGGKNAAQKTEQICLQDRFRTDFPVLCNCVHCYNIIYNSVPFSLHQKRRELEQLGLFAIRLDFVFESGRTVTDILNYYTGQKSAFPIREYTAGHYQRGVE